MQQKQENGFRAGLQRDTDEQYQPTDSYRDAKGLFVTAGLHLAQEQGLRLLPSRPGLPVMGGCALEQEEILFSTDGTTAEVGVQRGDVYTSILRSTALHMGAHVSATARLDYRGHRLVYWGDSTGFYQMDLDSIPAYIPQGLRVLPNPALAQVGVLSVSGGGELPTGIYLASVALLTASKNIINYSPFSNPCPIVDENLDSPHAVVDGAPPQTIGAGSITFHLSSLPAGYAYAQLVVATYVGLANQLQLHSLPLIALNGRTELDYVYYSASQHEQSVELGQVLNTLADFEQADVLTQKDGRLLAANVTTRGADLINWQEIANKIVLGPAIKDAPYAETGNNNKDYKDPLLSVSGKGLQRGEVYSFCLVPIMRGRALDAYHIPGKPQYFSDPLPRTAFAPYSSAIQYPTAGFYPAPSPGSTDNGIRHHRMPSIAEQPLVSNTSSDGATLRILGVQEVVSPDFSGLTLAQLADLDGYYIGMQLRTGANRSVLAQGIAQPLVPINNGYHAVSAFNGKWPTIRDDNSGNRIKGTGEYGAFYSAETAITQDVVTGADHLQCVALLSGDTRLPFTQRNNPIETLTAYAYFNLFNLAGSSAGGNIPLISTAHSVVGAADDYSSPLSEANASIYTWQQNGYVLLRADRTQATAGFYTGMADGQVDFQYHSKSGTDEVFVRVGDGTLQNQDGSGGGGIGSRYLYNLVRTRNRQYGSLEQATYYPVSLRRAGAPAVPFFNGDTFIGKVALQSDTAEYENSDNHGITFRTLNYYFCESTVNTAYRHTVAAGNGISGTLPYYPKLEQFYNTGGTGVMQYAPGLGHATGYNRQYSFTNRLTPLRPKDLTLEEVTAFNNRIYYSEESVEGEQLDAFRIFRANNYHDIPKDNGAITDLWTWDNKLYAHTSGALYHCFFNEASTTSTSEGEVYLGNGGLFPRPSMPLVSLEGGYAGCQHPKSAVSTPVGRFFTDAQGQRQYLFNGQLQELSKDGLREHFQQQLATPGNLVGCYEHAQERFLLHGLPQGALSWSVRTGKWCSFHDGAPIFALSTQRRTLLDDQGLGQLNAGTVRPCTLTTIANAPVDEAKVFTNVVLQTSRLPDSVSQATATQRTPTGSTFLKTVYGQEGTATNRMFTEANYQYQGAVGRDQATEAVLKGKWMAATTAWLATTVPVLIKQVTTLFRQSYR